MKSEMKKRKRNFGRICLAVVLLCTVIIPIGVFAASYDAFDEDGTRMLPTNLKAGDVVNYNHRPLPYAGDTYLYYLDEDGSSLEDIVIDDSSESRTGSFTVENYKDVKGSDNPGFKEWNVSYIYGSGKNLLSLKLKAVMYKKSNITYMMDGGTTARPSYYYEGKEEVTLKKATKSGKNFEGWYTTPSFTAGTEITVIPVTQTGDITLYAKYGASSATAATPVTPATPSGDGENGFVAYNIVYHLDGGTNGEGNPMHYTKGIGITSFADASKEGYSFAGWYTDGQFSAQLTSISAEQTGDVDLYAKYNEKVKDSVPETGEAKAFWLFALIFVSGAGMLLSGKTWNRNKK